MRVPSRSRKTARLIKLQNPNPKLQRNPKSKAPTTFCHGVRASGSIALRLRLGAWRFFGVWSLVFGASSLVFETGQQFLRRNGGGADLAHDNSGHVVGKDRRFERRCACGNGQGQRRDDRVTRARNIEDLLGHGRYVMRLLAALAEQHSLVAQRDQQQSRPQVAQQFFRGAHQSGVIQRIGGPRRTAVDHAGQFKRFLPIRRDEGYSRQVQMVNGLGVETEPEAARAAEFFDFIEQRLSYYPFAVIAQNDRVRGRKFPTQNFQQALRGHFVQVLARLAVDPHDLLLVRDDPCLDAGGAVKVLQQAVAANPLLLQQAR